MRKFARTGTKTKDAERGGRARERDNDKREKLVVASCLRADFFCSCSLEWSCIFFLFFISSRLPSCTFVTPPTFATSRAHVHFTVQSWYAASHYCNTNKPE